MESRLGTQGRTATQDFLSLYTPPAHVQQDPTPPQGGHLKTHDFLQPLERDGKHERSLTKEESRGGVGAVEKPPAPGPPASVEHLLPGGIGTYSISYFNQRPPTLEGSLFTTAQACSTTRNDENSNCSSYTGSDFTLWDESAAKKGKTGKENIVAQRHALQEAGVNVLGGQWATLLDKPLQSSSHHKNNNATFSSFTSSQLSSSQNTQSFMDMITSAKNEQEEDDDDDEDRFVVKKELSSHPKGNLSVKTEAKTIDQRPSTPRSKHSATEQRRRSKINDRFQRLREIIPNSDQKRDKASFLLEVIDYIHFLQEKVTKYERPYNTWSHESSKMVQLRNCHVSDGFIDHTRGAKTEPCSASRFDKNKASVSPTLSIPTIGQNLINSEPNTAATFKERGQQQPVITPKVAPLHPVQPSIFNFGRSSIAASPVSPKPTSDTDKATAWPPSPQFQLNRSHSAGFTSAGQDMAVENGTISISNVYSQELLNTLTKALRTSGVDLSRAYISVQINLAKRAYSNTHSSTSAAKDVDNQATEKDSGRTSKKLRTN